MITSMQLKMARVAKGWGVRDLARRAGINPNTVSRIENGKNATESVRLRLETAFADVGVMFFHDATNGSYGVKVLPEFDGWSVNLDEGWARSDRAIVTFWHDADGTRSIGPVAPVADNLPKADLRKIGQSAMAAVTKALRARAGKFAQPIKVAERDTKLRLLREAVDIGLRSGRAADSSMQSILDELDREG